MLGLPFNPGCINRNHTHGTHAPVEEPSTASIADIDGLRGPLTERFGLRQELCRIPSIARLVPFSSLVGLTMFPSVSRDILVAYADRQTPSQSPELRPYNWEISVEGER